MLGIPKQFLDCSVYLYKTQAHADKGEQSGGSGFLVGVPLTQNPEETQFYVVTNEHVIREMDRPTIRLNRIEGKAESHSTNLQRWIRHTPSDLAIYPLEVVEEDFRLAWVPFSRLLDAPKMRVLEILPGGEVFMIGRFVGHDGRQRNTPSVRFGNISRMPIDDPEDAVDENRESADNRFLIDCRSIPGYSGSPVFFMFDPAKPRPPHWEPPVPYDPDWHGPWLLGVDSFHIPSFEQVLTEKDPEKPADPKRWVQTNSGMAGIIPAWEIRELLLHADFEAQRHTRDNRITDTKRRDLK